MDFTAQVTAIQTASAQVDALTAGALATDAANQSMQQALQAARVQLANAQAALLAAAAPAASVATTPDTTITPDPAPVALSDPTTASAAPAAV